MSRTGLAILLPMTLASCLACCGPSEPDADDAPRASGAGAPAAAAGDVPDDFGVALGGEPIRVERRESGLVVEVFAEGEGEALAPGRVGVVAYEMRLAEGRVIRSSKEQRAHLRVPLVEGRAIPGLLEGLEGMRPGGARRLRIPHTLAYGEVGRPPIPPKADLVIDVRLVGIAAPE